MSPLLMIDKGLRGEGPELELLSEAIISDLVSSIILNKVAKSAVKVVGRRK